jgi:Tfp pilus assembly protein PilF
MAQMRQGVDRGLASQRLPELLVQDGLLRLRSGDAVRARAALEEALKIDPSALIALRILGQTYASEKRLSTGMEKVREYASQQQKSAPVQHFLGMMLLGTGDRTGARAAFQAAKAADKDFVAADLGLAQVDAADGKLDEAKTRLTSVIAADSSNMTAQKWLGNVEAVRGDHNAAITHFRKVLELDPSDSQASNNLAYLLIEYRNEFDEALKYAQKAVELVPDRPAYLDTLGWAHYQKRQYPTAIRYLERASASNQSAAWKYHLAMAYAKAGDLTRGRATLAAAMKQNPRAPEAKAAQEVVGTFK